MSGRDGHLFNESQLHSGRLAVPEPAIVVYAGDGPAEFGWHTHVIRRCAERLPKLKCARAVVGCSPNRIFRSAILAGMPGSRNVATWRSDAGC